MFYITKCYVGHAGTTLRPGEAFEADSQDEKIKWLLSQEAIVPATPAFVAQDENDDQQDDDAQNDQQMDVFVEFDTGDDDLTEDDEPLEIDGLDSIVAVEPQEAPAADATTAKKGRKKA